MYGSQFAEARSRNGIENAGPGKRTPPKSLESLCALKSALVTSMIPGLPPRSGSTPKPNYLDRLLEQEGTASAGSRGGRQVQAEN
jgi:hypothetical protein